MAQANRNRSPLKPPLKSGAQPQENDKVFALLQEMFHGKVDPEVVHMILTEMDWKVERAIDTLLTFCGEGNSTDNKKKNRLYKIAHETLCKDKSPTPTEVEPKLSSPGPNSRQHSLTLSPATGSSRPNSRQTSVSPSKGSKLPSRHVDSANLMPQLVNPPEINDYAIASNSQVSAVGLERKKAATSKSSIDTIRNAMASAYGTKQGGQNLENGGILEPAINPMSVDNDVEIDSNLLTQSILSGAMNLSSTGIPELSPLSPSKMYNPFSESQSKGMNLESSYQAYMEKHWPDLAGSLKTRGQTGLQGDQPNKSREDESSINTFPGMYTNENAGRTSMESHSGHLYDTSMKESAMKEYSNNETNFPRTGIGNQQSSLLERLGLAEKNDLGQLKNLQRDPEEDLDLNFNMETFDCEPEDSSSDGSNLSQSGSAETMAAELKNMLGISKEDIKKEPTLLESAAKELERLNALSPNAKEFVPRSTTQDAIGSGSRSPKFLTPKASLPSQPRMVPPYAMIQQHLPPMNLQQQSPLRPVYPLHPPYTSSIPVMPVNLMGVRNRPPGPMGMLPPSSQYGPVMPPTSFMSRPPLLPPPGMVPISCPSPILFRPQPGSPYQTPPAGSPLPQQMSEGQQYATVAASQALHRMSPKTGKESSPSPEKFLSPESQAAMEKIKSGIRILIILRGLPGSGKTTLASELCGDGVIVSADNYFMEGNMYRYDQTKLSEAHDDCRQKAREAVQAGVTPVIVDNTNTQVWEMCAYVDIAQSVDPEYEICILEPSTPWKFKARYCAEKTKHGVPYDRIKKMLDRYQRNVTVEMLINMKSQSRPPMSRLPKNKSNSAIEETKPLPKEADVIEPNSLDQNEDIWENVGSIKMKNPYEVLMEMEEGLEGEESDNEDNDNALDNKEDKSKEIEKEENQPKSSTEIASTENKKVAPLSTPLGFQIKPQKALSVLGLQKKIDMISQHKLLVSSSSSSSPITVQADSTEDLTQKARTSRTPSFEKVPEIDLKVSREIQELVDGLISEHVVNKLLTQSEMAVLQEELKAYLHIMPFDDQQRADAENLIDYKLSLFLEEETGLGNEEKPNEDGTDSMQNPEKRKDKCDDRLDSNVLSNNASRVVDQSKIGLENIASDSNETGQVDQNMNGTFASSVTEENTTDQSIDLSLEKVFNRTNESVNGSLVLNNENTTLEGIKNADYLQIENENKTTSASKEKDGGLRNKEYNKYMSKDTDTNTCEKHKSPLDNAPESSSLGLASKNESEDLKNRDFSSKNSKKIEQDCLGADFWHDESKRKDFEENYWKNGTKLDNSSSSSVLISDKLEAGAVKKISDDIAHSWEEPKSKREPKRNRDKKSPETNDKQINSKSLEKSTQETQTTIKEKKKPEPMKKGVTNSNSTVKSVKPSKDSDQDGKKTDKAKLPSQTGFKEKTKDSKSSLASKNVVNVDKNQTVAKELSNKAKKDQKTKPRLPSSVSVNDSSKKETKTSDKPASESTKGTEMKNKSKSTKAVEPKDAERPAQDRSKTTKVTEMKDKTKITKDVVLKSGEKPAQEDVSSSLKSKSKLLKSKENKEPDIKTKTNIEKVSTSTTSSKAKTKSVTDKKSKAQSKSDNSNHGKSEKTNLSSENKLPTEDSSLRLEDKSSFIIQHFQDAFNQDSRPLDISSLLSPKTKTRQLLTIESKEVQMKLKEGNVKGKLESGNEAKGNTQHAQKKHGGSAENGGKEKHLQANQESHIQGPTSSVLNNDISMHQEKVIQIPKSDSDSSQISFTSYELRNNEEVCQSSTLDSLSHQQVDNSPNSYSVSSLDPQSLQQKDSCNINPVPSINSQLQPGQHEDLSINSKVSPTSDNLQVWQHEDLSNNSPVPPHNNTELQQHDNLSNSTINTVSSSSDTLQTQQPDSIPVQVDSLPLQHHDNSTNSTINTTSSSSDTLQTQQPGADSLINIPVPLKNSQQLEISIASTVNPVLNLEKSDSQILTDTKSDIEQSITNICTPSSPKVENSNSESTTDVNISSNKENSNNDQNLKSGNSEVKDGSSSVSVAPENEAKGPAAKKKKKNNNKRKMVAKFPEKFLDDSVKIACLNNDWKTQMPKLEGSAPLSFEPLQRPTKHVLSDKQVDRNTSITSVDLNVLSFIEDGNYDILRQLDHPYQICIGRSYRFNGADNKGETSTSIPAIIHPDKSTMTEKMSVAGVDFLQSSFPTIPVKELKDILEKCDGDVEWAVNLLLDWKYHLNLSEEDSEKFVDVVFKSQNIPKSPTIHSVLRSRSRTSLLSPPSLLDMCYTLVVNQQNIDRQEIEQKLILSSEVRLKSLENQYVEVQKQYSFTSCGDEIVEDDKEFSDALLQELIHSAETKSLSSESDSSSQVSGDDSFHISNSGLSIENPEEFWNVDQDPSRNITPAKEADRVTFDLDEIEDEDEVRIVEKVQLREERERTHSFGEPTVLLPLRKDFTKALFTLFGQIDGIDTDKDEDITIPVSLDVAKLMYTCIKTASQKGQVRVHSDKQLQEDEAYARRLQEQEDSEVHQLDGPRYSTPQSRGRPPQHVLGLSMDQNLNLSTRTQKVVSLQEIIDEQQAIENEKRNMVETLRQSGSFSALSTKLKQHNLYNRFPGIDQTVLDDIFHANGCKLEDTIKAIQGSLGYDAGAPKIVISKEAEEMYEEHLIEAAKQQSLQEMLDSCLHYVHVPQIRVQTVTDAPTIQNSEDYQEFRGEANLHYRLRHECFQKAQEAYKRGMKQVASFYSDQGHQHTQKIKNANFRASEQILATRNDMLEKNSTLDLHGLHVDEAVAALERILPSKEFELQTNPLKQKHYLIIVTGRGKHSHGGVSKLKPAVISYLRRNEYRFSEIHEGALRVNLKHRSIA